MYSPITCLLKNEFLRKWRLVNFISTSNISESRLRVETYLDTSKKVTLYQFFKAYYYLRLVQWGEMSVALINFTE